MKKIDLYPSTVYVDSLYNKIYISECIDIAYELFKENIKYNDCSVRNGWQSSKELYNIPHFSKLADDLLKIIKTNLLKEDVNPFISSMWLNIHEKNGFNHIHTHPGSWYSGVFYLKCSDESGKITFTDPRPGAEMCFYHQEIEGNLYSISPKVGDFILFPSWLPHLVEQNLSDSFRISISFNVELDI